MRYVITNNNTILIYNYEGCRIFGHMGDGYWEITEYDQNGDMIDYDMGPRTK